MTPEQVPLALSHRPALGREDFVVAPSNAEAVAVLDRWPDWPHPIVVVTGAEGSGKTHLAEVWRARSGAPLVAPEALRLDSVAALADAPHLALDGLDRPFEQEALFHLVNAFRMQGKSLLITAREAPARWNLDLPDLASRLGEAFVATLGPPEDGLLAALIIKLAADRGLDAPPELVNYLVNRIDRSCAAAVAAVAALDAASLARRRPLTVPLARDVLGAERPQRGRCHDKV